MPSEAVKKKTRSSLRGRIKKQKTALVLEEILDVAARLIAERGFRAVTVDDISAEMGFTKSIIYYNLKNKNEILWRIFESIDRHYSAAIDEVFEAGGTPVEMLSNMIRTHCLNVLNHQAWSTIYNRDENELTEDQRRTVSANKRRYNKRVEELYEQGVEAGYFRNIPAAIAVSGMIGACNWAYTWFKPSGKHSAEEIAAAYADLLIDGVALRPDSRSPEA